MSEPGPAIGGCIGAFVARGYIAAKHQTQLISDRLQQLLIEGDVRRAMKAELLSSFHVCVVNTPGETFVDWN